VDDDEAEGLDGGEDGGAGADNDVGLAVADLVPLVVAFAGAEVAVEDGDVLVSEAGAETFDGLWREGNFPDGGDGVFAVAEGVFDGLEVDFGFAAAGDAVDEDGFGGVRSVGA